MRTSKTFATLALLSLAVTALGAAGARADDEPPAAAAPAPAPAGDLVGTQVQVTRDTLAKLMRDLESTSTGAADPSLHADFAFKAKAFENKVSNAMTGFEAALKSTILPQIALFAQNYDSTFNSTAYNGSEKQALLGSIGTQLSGAVATGAQSYFVEIRKVLAVAGPIIMQMTSYDSMWSDDRIYEIKDLDGHVVLGLGSDGLRSDDQYQTAFKKIVLPTAQAGCLSVSCIELSSMMLLRFVTLVTTDLLQNVSFALADGNTVAMSLDGYRDLASQLTLDLLSHVYIPDNVRSKLPLNCTPADFAKHQRSGD